jgi:hypothetical protein
MQWHLQYNVLAAQSRTLIDVSRNLLCASRNLSAEARFRVQKMKLRAMENQSAGQKPVEKRAA